MKIAPHPENEASRLAAVKRLGILDTPPETILDNIAQAAADVCGTQIALISFIDSTRQWFKSSAGIALQQTPRDMAFCTHTILEPDGFMEVEDTSLDERFWDNPLVTNHPKVRFYAGTPLLTHDGYAVGTLCVVDSKPLTLSHSQKNALNGMAQVVMGLLDERREFRLGANDDFVEKVVLERVKVANRNQLIANSSTLNPNDLNENQQIRINRSRINDHGVVECLNSIVSSAIEYDLHLEPTRLVNFVYFYCAYLQSTIPQSAQNSGKLVELNVIPATFLQYIFDQTLLNETASYIEYHEGEQIDAPAAVENQIQ